ncbi:MAG: cytochrome b [Pseudomonadota bacterium]
METKRYTSVAIALHWLIAFSIVGMAAAGLYMTQLPLTHPNKFDLYQLHKSFGITVLLLSAARLGWRLTHPAPPLPSGMKDWERTAARFTHIAFYVLIIAIPFAGWAMVSASVYNIPTKLYGFIPWPHLPVLNALDNKEPVEEALKGIHEYLAFAALGLLVVHAGAALKHHFVNKDDVLTRMVPFLRPKS